MRIRTVLQVLSVICAMVSLFMLFPTVLAFADGGADAVPFASSVACGLSVSAAMFALGSIAGNPLPRGGHGAERRENRFAVRDEHLVIGVREAIGVVGFSWIIASLIGGMPYWMSGAATTYAAAFFETMSGFTTTGATIVTDIEALPRGLLLWRAMTHWLGGMGIIVFGLAILPFLGINGMELFKAEVPGPTPEKLTPRLRQTAVMLWTMYFALTALETIFLMFGGMDLFDAVTHSFSTIATGGFSTKNASIAYYGSAYIEWVIIVFMFASGVNFSLYFLLLAGRMREAVRDEELRYYTAVVALSSAVIAAVLVSSGAADSISASVRAASFHVVSLITTTGFVANDYALWPAFTQFLMFMLMLVGACAGSTGGGCKVVRFMLLSRQVGSRIACLLHPRAVVTVRMNGRPVSRDTLDAAAAFLMLYLFILAGATLIVLAFGHPKLDVLTSLSGVVACLGNVGPGLSALGPTENFAWLPDGVKWVLSFCMLAGRLELFSVILLFVPGTWTR